MNEPDYDDPFLEIKYALKRNYEEAARIRRMVLEQVEAGHTQRDIGRRLGIGASTLGHWIRTARAERDEHADRRNTDHLPYGRRGK
jgi:transposase-like protein